MATSYSQFQKKHIDLTPVGLEKSTDPGTYFCTPKGASIIGFAGVDGIHYCFVRGFGEMVFAVSPMNTAPDYVHPLAKDFTDFLRLLLRVEMPLLWNRHGCGIKRSLNPS